MVPEDSANDAAFVQGGEIYAAGHLLDVSAHLRVQDKLPLHEVEVQADAAPVFEDLADVRGQHYARRALEVTAAGGHSLLMIGTPGTDKTMLASRLPGILPRVNEDEAMEAAAISSISDRRFNIANWKRRGFRAPHQTASGVAMVGGGSHPRPGEISLAHQGVLFLDELPEFDRRVLEVSCEPLESGRITISRAACHTEFPARFQLVTAMNPCPCGYYGHSNGRCHCTVEQIQLYRNRISGPLLDRIDIHVEVPNVPRALLTNDQAETPETSAVVRESVARCSQLQNRRNGKRNSLLMNREVDSVCRLSQQDAEMLEQVIDKPGLAARTYHRILKVARTIADLADAEKINTVHLSEAIGYRRLDRMAPSQ